MDKADRSRTNIFLDSDLILDFLFGREPWRSEAHNQTLRIGCRWSVR